MLAKLYHSYTYLRLHIFCWALFIAYELMVTITFSGKFSNFFDYTGHYILNISLFYFNAYVVFKKTINPQKKTYLLLLLCIIGELAFYGILKYLLYIFFVFVGIYNRAQLSINFLFITETLWRAIYFIGLSTGYWFAVSTVSYRKKISILESHRLRAVLEKELSEKSLLQAENAFLKTQINPHFLFNSLGFIHNKVSKYSEEAGDAIILLTDIMRYALNEIKEDNLVELNDEIEYINNYILINQYRFDNTLCLNFEQSGSFDQVRIIPLLLITIVENVFKYAELFDDENPAIIRAEFNQGNFYFTVLNKISSRVRMPGYGIGMTNVQRRLEMHYKDNFTMDISETTNCYNLKLSIKIK